MRGLGKIFLFTFVQHVKRKGYLNVTIIIAFLCLLLPAAIMPAVEYFKEDDTYESKLAKVYVIEQDGRTDEKTDYGVLNRVDAERFTDVAYEMAGSVEEAAKKAEEEDYRRNLCVQQQ